jgi:agmatine deiminase
MPAASSLHVPAEWSPHSALWLGWPSHADLWAEDLAPAQAEVAALARALAGPGKENVQLLCSGADAANAARLVLGDVDGVTIVEGRFGDVWLRDTGPIFTASGQAEAFAFNGWGGKYQLEGDDMVADQIAQHAGAALRRHGFVLEGGALEHDGEGTVITTRQCLLNPNRNPGWTEKEAEAALKGALGVEKVLWLDEGLANDHTDGHVDNLARFVAPGLVLCPLAWGQKDVNAEVYDAIAKALSGMTDAAGRKLEVGRLPSPGRVTDAEGFIVPASHMNFIIGNEVVVAPIYEERPGLLAVDALEMYIPDRMIMGRDSRALLSGGGSFHCITQQVPA